MAKAKPTRKTKLAKAQPPSDMPSKEEFQDFHNSQQQVRLFIEPSRIKELLSAGDTYYIPITYLTFNPQLIEGLKSHKVYKWLAQGGKYNDVKRVFFANTFNKNRNHLRDFYEMCLCGLIARACRRYLENLEYVAKAQRIAAQKNSVDKAVKKAKSMIDLIKPDEFPLEPEAKSHLENALTNLLSELKGDDMRNVPMYPQRAFFYDLGYSFKKIFFGEPSAQLVCCIYSRIDDSFDNVRMVYKVLELVEEPSKSNSDIDFSGSGLSIHETFAVMLFNRDANDARRQVVSEVDFIGAKELVELLRKEFMALQAGIMAIHKLLPPEISELYKM